jgi:hypothetical protein
LELPLKRTTGADLEIGVPRAATVRERWIWVFPLDLTFDEVVMVLWATHENESRMTFGRAACLANPQCQAA